MESLPPGVDPSTISFEPNPNGGPPDFSHSPSLLQAVIGVGLTMIITSAAFVAIRLFTNLKHAGKLGLDDCMSFQVIVATFFKGISTSLPISLTISTDLCLFAEVGGIIYWALFYSGELPDRFQVVFCRKADNPQLVLRVPADIHGMFRLPLLHLL